MSCKPFCLFVVAVVFCAVSPAARSQDAPREAEPSPPDRQRVELEVGFDTTYFDGPLREDGTVDYIAALNEKYSEGVTLENNAFVELLLLTPAARRGEQDAEVMQALGLPREREDEGACFVTWEAYAIEQGIEDYQEARYYLREDSTVTPEGEAWLAVNRVALDRMVEATRRERYFAPLVAEQGGAETDKLFSVILPHLSVERSYARALQARIYTRAHAGDEVGAAEDLLAIRRHAALVSCDLPFVGGLVGISIDKLGLEATSHMLASGDSDADHLKMLAAHWDDRVVRVPIAEKFTICERCISLDMLQQMWTGRLGEVFVPELDWARANFNFMRFDINRSLRTLNQDYNEISRLMRIEDYRRFIRLQEQWGEEFDAQHPIAEPNGREQVEAFMQASTLLTRDEYTDALTSWFKCLVVPNLEVARRVEIQIDTFDHVIFVALQCERYRLATGKIPPSLEVLVPEYLSEAPRDPIDGEPLRYLVTDTKYTVYSIGTDLEDDGGVDDHGEGDIAVVVGLAAE